MARKKAFTLVELLVVISIIATLLAILMPSLNRARDAGRSAVCKSNLRTIGIAEVIFAQNNDDKVAWARYDFWDPDYRVYFWAAQLWAEYYKIKIPGYYDLSVPPITSPKWLMCPAQILLCWLNDVK